MVKKLGQHGRVDIYDSSAKRNAAALAQGLRTAAISAIAIKIEDGDQSRRALKATSVETLAQVGILDDRDLRALAAYHHPTVSAPGGAEAASAVAHFELVGQGKRP